MTSTHDIDDVATFHQWLSEVTGQTCARFGADDRLGTANYVDPSARLRAAACIRTGEAVDLARPLVEGPGFHVERTSDAAGFVVLDRVESSCHGHAKTHMDALNHMSSNGTFYGGRSLDDADLPTVVDLAGRCLFTRALFADITAVRGTPWVAPGEPVSDVDIEAALDGVDILPGDALVLYMGRDRWEAAGNTFDHVDGGPRSPDRRKPGAGRSAARWIVEHQISIVAWDFLDAQDDPDAPTEAKGTVHRLLPATGLILIDNCDMASAAAVLSRTNRRVAAFAALPLAVPGGTGSLVTPWLIL